MRVNKSEKSRPDFSIEEWQIIKPLTEEVTVEKGSFLFMEGSQTEELYFLEKGGMEIVKKGHHLAHLHPGDWVGEVATFSEKKIRTASVWAKEKSTLLKISLLDLKKATLQAPEVYNKVLKIISIGMARRLQLSNERMVLAFHKRSELSRVRIAMGQFLCYMLLAIACFFYILKVIDILQLNPKVSSVISIPLILLLGYFLYLIMKKSGYPISTYGLTWKNWKKSTIESLIATIPLILFFLLLKWVIISTVPMFKDKSLFIYPQLVSEHLSTLDWILITVGYPLLAPLQEVMARGCLQGSLEKFLVGHRKTFFAIILSNLLFSTLHLQLSLEVSIYAFICGCYWGWLYSRHHTIVGVSISHMIFGLFGFVFLGPLT
jgi:hypothetical protein